MQTSKYGSARQFPESMNWMAVILDEQMCLGDKLWYNDNKKSLMFFEIGEKSVT